MVLIEIFIIFFPLPGRRRWQNLFHGKFQFLFPIWKRNRIISLRRKKKLQKVARSPWEAEEPAQPREDPRTWGTARHGWTLGWGGSDAKPDLSPTTKLCQDPNLLALPPSPT